jgi:hypothetical protein
LVRDAVAEWYERWAPGIARDAAVPMLCLKCWQAARRGDLHLERLDLPPELVVRLQEQIEEEDPHA